MSSDPSPLHWVDDSAYWSANGVQHAIAGDYELIAYDIPPIGNAAAKIGWEIYVGPSHSQTCQGAGGNEFQRSKSCC